MLAVNVPHPNGLLGNMEHHGKEAMPQALALIAWITFLLGPRNELWTLEQSRQGANSFSLKGPKGEFHFRGKGHGDKTITVLDKAQNGNVVAAIVSRVQAKRFVENLIV